jgi:HD-GYP domain-containing protein (c-di-GMP phosphodiesterase class II)
LISRIITVADAFEAMTAIRPYQRTRTKEEALEELERFSEIQFDPDIVNIFVKLMSD